MGARIVERMNNWGDEIERDVGGMER